MSAKKNKSASPTPSSSASQSEAGVARAEDISGARSARVGDIIPNPKIQTADAVTDGLTTADSGQPTVTTDAPPPKEEPLELPKGALIAYRKSGGLKFSSREVVVYPDGRVTYGGGDTSKNMLTRASRKLMDAQVTKLRRTLDTSGFWKLKPPEGKHGGDAFAHEFISRVGAKHNRFEVFTGAIPAALAPLIEQLERLLPSEAE